MRTGEFSDAALSVLRLGGWPVSSPAETRRMVSVPPQVFLELLSVTVRLGECHAVLADLLALAQRSPELRDEQLRAVLVAVGERAARLVEGGTR